jgi:hypothetical protein
MHEHSLVKHQQADQPYQEKGDGFVYDIPDSSFHQAAKIDKETTTTAAAKQKK